MSAPAIDHPANARARQRRATLPEFNDFDLYALMDMPPYWGWVYHRVDATAQPFHMLLGGNDDGVALRLFWNGQYERTTLALWAGLAHRHALAIDIGAHTGIYTLAARAANSAINVLPFEPHAANFARLALNLRANGFSTTDAYPLGVSDTAGARRFTVRTHPDYHSSGGTFETAGAEDTTAMTNDVRVAALDSFLPPRIAEAVGLIKLDTEGHEPAVLSGMRVVVTRARPTLIFECLSETTARAVHDLCGPLGYRFYEIDDRTGTVREAEKPSASLPAHCRNWIASARADDLAIIGKSG